MKQILIFILITFPLLVTAQGHKGDVKECAPMKEGKICYRDTVHVKDLDQKQIFNIINEWAKKNYGKDIFLSNVSTKKSKGLINISSKIELLLNETDKTTVKYKMKIFCHDNSYVVEVSNIVYLYDPKEEKKYKTYPAESVIANNGESNTIAIIKDPKLFCNATFFFVENLFADILEAINEAE